MQQQIKCNKSFPVIEDVFSRLCGVGYTRARGNSRFRSESPQLRENCMNGREILQSFHAGWWEAGLNDSDGDLNCIRIK